MALLSAAAWIAARHKRALPLLRSTLRLRSAGRRLELVERLQLTPSHALHLIECDRRALLIATYPGGASVAVAPAGGPFADVLAASAASPLHDRSTEESRA